MQKHKIKIFGFIVFASIALTAVALIFWQGLQPFLVSKNISLPFAKKEPAGVARLLDGVYLEKGETEKYPVAVMIDNKFEARPQSGISFAGLVFEAPVEGGITRFMAIFSTDKKLEKVGPVRSVRPYYIDWASEFSAFLMHIGGSPEALDIIASNPDIKKLNLDGNGEYFWRAADRYAPHNAYTSSEKFDLIRSAKLDSQDLKFLPWKFKDDAAEEARGDAKKITIDYSPYDNYDASWEYDRLKNVYVRQDKNGAFKTLEDSLILAKNIAVVETDITIIDEVSRRHIVTIGGGNALIFQDGKKIEGKWEKKDQGSRLRFYDGSGKEIEFDRGTTWVEVVDDLGKVMEN
ncbi:MAG: DUF3048 domain-containing protein [bacterium]